MLGDTEIIEDHVKDFGDTPLFLNIFYCHGNAGSETIGLDLTATSLLTGEAIGPEAQGG